MTSATLCLWNDPFLPSLLLTPDSDLKHSKRLNLRYGFENSLLIKLQKPRNHQTILFNCACYMLQFHITYFIWICTCEIRFGDQKTWPQAGENYFSLFSPLTLSLNLWSIVNNKLVLTIDPIWNAKLLTRVYINLVNMLWVHDITETVFSGAHIAQMWLWTPSCYSPAHALLPANHPLPGADQGIKAFINL